MPWLYHKNFNNWDMKKSYCKCTAKSDSFTMKECVQKIQMDWQSDVGLHCLLLPVWPGCVVQSVGHLTHKSGVLGSIPGLATYFRFLSVTGESMCTKYWLTA